MSTSMVKGPSLGPRDQTTLVGQTAADPKIHSRHLTRQAVIYVRQSHPNALRQHPESARRQYGLTERAQRLGWGAGQLRVIDERTGENPPGWLWPRMEAGTLVV